MKMRAYNNDVFSCIREATFLYFYLDKVLRKSSHSTENRLRLLFKFDTKIDFRIIIVSLNFAFFPFKFILSNF